jgi:hypothetical protein
LLFSTDAILIPHDVLTLHPTTVEYHKPLTFSAQVESCTPARREGTPPYTEAVLTVVQGEALATLLTPGTCLVTTYTWDDLKRA